MERLRARLEATLNDATRRAYAQLAVRKRRVMADSLPMTLRTYRRLSAAVALLAPALIKRRLKQGKEDPARIGERRGMSRDTRRMTFGLDSRPSVGEVLAAAALIERLRALISASC